MARPSAGPAKARRRLRPRTVRRAVAAGVLVAAVAAAGWWALRQRPPAAASVEEARGWEIPEPDITRFSPLVGRRVGDAKLRVLADAASADAWGAYGEVLDAHGLLEHAEVAYEHATQLAPLEPKWHYHLGYARTRLGYPVERFRGPFERALALSDSPAVGIRYGQALMAAGESDDGVAILEDVARRQPDMAAAHETLGTALLAAGRAEEAVAALQRAVALVPDASNALSALSRAYRQLGRTAEAEQAAERAKGATGKVPLPDSWRRAVDEQAVSPDSLAKRAQSAMDAKRFLEAIPIWKLFLEGEAAAGGDVALAHMHLGTAYVETGQFDLAEPEMRAALALRDDLFPAHAGLGFLASRRGDFAAAEPHLRRAVELKPGDEKARTDLGIALAAQGRMEAALAEFDLAAGEDGRLDADGETRWGMALLGAGRPAEALEHYQRALAEKPDSAAILHALGECWERLGNVEKALLFYRRAVKQDPRSPAAGRVAELGG